MIVLRITVDGRSWNVEKSTPRVLIGTATDADVREDGVGWGLAEAVLHHQGTEVLLDRPNAGTQLRLRVGDGVRLGRARVTLVGLLPLPEQAPPAAAPPLFGGYEDEAVGAGSAFDLAPPSSKPSPPPPGSGPVQETSRPAAPPGARPSTRPSTRPSPPAHASTGRAAPDRPVSEEPPGRAGSTSRGVVPAPRPPTPAFRNAEFGSELVAQIRRAPFLVLSVALHALVFILLAMIQSDTDQGAKDRRDGSLFASLRPPTEQERQPDDDEDPLGEEPASPAMPELPELVLPDPMSMAASGQPEDSETMRLDPLPPATAEADPLVGLNPSVVNARVRKGRNLMPMPNVDLKQAFAKGTATGANQQAADFVRAQLGRGRGSDGSALDALVKNDILVVDGSFDRIGRVLHALHLPYTLVTPIALSLEKAPPLEQHKIVFWNCGESLSPPRRAVAARRIREFVRRGGYLFTTDWAIGNILIHAFPEFLDTSGPISPLPETVVDIEPAPGKARHPLLRGVFLPGTQGKWWLEQASFDVKVKRGRDVEVLITSKELEEKFKREPGVAVLFPYGHGKVLHVMGHYFQEEGNMAGTIAAHRLALNFVLMRLQARQRTRR